MNKQKNNNFLILLGVFIIISALRIVLNKNPYIVNIIGAINVIAFLYVFYLILEQTEQTFIEELPIHSCCGKQVIIKKKKYFKRIINVTKPLILILGLIYCFFASSVSNDIISLGALFLSIQTETICRFLSDYLIQKK